MGDFEGSGALQPNPLYQGLDVVHQGRVVPGVEPVEGALYWGQRDQPALRPRPARPATAAALDAAPATPIP